jgi:hypothetical protein
MRQYREYARKRRQDDGFRKKEADKKREYRKFKKVAELKMEDEFSIMEAKVERLQRKVEQFDEFLILLFQNEDFENSFERRRDSDRFSGGAKCRTFPDWFQRFDSSWRKTELYHRLCGLERSTFNDLANELEMPFKQFTWCADARSEPNQHFGSSC